MRLTSLLAVIASLLALGATFHAAAAAQSQQASARASDDAFNAQARAEGLSAAEARRLRTRVDRIVERTGGRQIALNQIAWAGGDTLVPLPNERRARDLGETTRASGTVHGCHYLQFCTYSSAHYTGLVDRMSSCTWHTSHAFFRSYVNNQTAGTRARLYRGDRKLLTRTRPALSQGTTSYGAAFYIRPC